MVSPLCEAFCGWIIFYYRYDHGVILSFSHGSMQLGNIEHDRFACKGNWLVLTHSPLSTMIVDSQFQDTKRSSEQVPGDEGDLDGDKI